MHIKDILTRLRQFDAYPKTLEDFRVKTFGGATVTIISGILMTVLFLSEFNYYLTKEVHPELFVDTSRGQKLKINVDITFPVVGCSYLSLDAMDVSGEQQIDIDANILKQRLDLDGAEIGDDPEQEALGDESDSLIEGMKEELKADRCESCYGAESTKFKCCNTCSAVREAYRAKGWQIGEMENIVQCKREGVRSKLTIMKKEGCRVYGYLEVNKETNPVQGTGYILPRPCQVAGNFHIAPGKSFQQHHVHVHDLQEFTSAKFNLSHYVNHLSFGTHYPGLQNPLDATNQIAEQASTMYQYFVKIVPTLYVNIDQNMVHTNQYSVTRHHKVVSYGFSGEQGLPGVFVMYELSPMMVKYTEKRRSFMHFLTSVCAIVGGIFTVAGLIDSCIYHSAKVIQKKIELGKLS